jgi:hypothetical protein
MKSPYRWRTIGIPGLDPGFAGEAATSGNTDLASQQAFYSVRGYPVVILPTHKRVAVYFVAGCQFLQSFAIHWAVDFTHYLVVPSSRHCRCQNVLSDDRSASFN